MGILGRAYFIVLAAIIFCVQLQASELDLSCVDGVITCDVNSVAKIFFDGTDGDGGSDFIDDMVFKRGLLNYITTVVNGWFHKESSNLYAENKKLKEVLAKFMVTISYLKTKQQEKDNLIKHIWDGITQLLAHNNKQNDDEVAFLNSCLQQLSSDDQSSDSRTSDDQALMSVVLKMNCNVN